MKVATVDDGDIDRRAFQLAGSIEPPEPSSENDDAVSDTFRIAKSRL
jgi:hypothetical protein